MANYTLPAIASRTLTDEEAQLLRKICDEHQFPYGVFCGIIVKDALQSEERIAHYVKKTRQFEEDQKPASLAELKALREKLRQQEEELEALRQFKQTAQDSLTPHPLSR